MAQVLLFDGGSNGGLLQGSQGVRPIPPFDPALREELRALGALLRAVSANPNEDERRTIMEHARKLAGYVIEQVEGVVGPLDDQAGLVYQDEGGGFTCGSSGKPPLPFPWPATQITGVEEVLGVGILEQELIELFQRAPDIDTAMFLERPAEIAAEHGVKLSARTTEHLQRLAPSRINEISDPATREVVEFFHRVLADRRYVDSWSRRPYEVAQQLGVELSPPAADLILAGGNALGIPNASRVGIIWVVVVIVVGVIVLVDYQAKIVVRSIDDHSGLKKL
jgi:hypothetical protein